MYVVERKVASGGMATVFRGYDPALDRPVAIKVLRPELATAVGAERFLREARHLAQVSHPNVIAVHEVGEADGLYFYVMDLVDAPTLGQLLKEGPLSLRESLRVTTDLLKALEAVHSAGLIHRDVKPSNIFVAKDRAILADFGIAKSVELKDAEPLTSDGQMIGTPGYMAPEQRYGDDVTPRADLYGAGLILFKCMTGRDWTLSEPVEITLSDVPDEFRQVVSRAVAIDPDDRWPDAAAFRAALIEAAPPGAHPEGPAASSALTGRRLASVIVLLTASSALAAIVVSRACVDDVAVPIDLIAWLTCDDLSPESELGALAANLADELTNRLSRLGLPGVSRGTADAIKELGLDPREIGELTGAGAVVECDVLRGRDSLRVDVRVFGTPRGNVRLEDGYHGVWGDVFKIQDEITRDVAVELLGIQPPPEPGAPNLDAYQFYLLGRQEWWGRTGPALRRAENWFRRALEVDSSYARAHAGLADVYVVLTARGLRDLVPDSAFRVARQHAERAIELDSALAEPWAALAEAKRAFFWDDWRGAESDYGKAIAINPSYALAHTWYSLYLSAMGRHDSAVAEARRAVDLSSLSSSMWRGLATVQFYQGEHEEALASAERAFSLAVTSSDSSESLFWQMGVLLVTGAHESALSLLRATEAQAAASPPAPLYRAVLAYGFAAAGDSAHARRILQHLPPSPDSVQTYVSPFWMAVANAHLGETDLAFDWLDAAYDLRDEFMVHLAVNPAVAPLRGDPRLAALEEKMAKLIGPQLGTDR